jgi:hypothetical protein
MKSGFVITKAKEISSIHKNMPAIRKIVFPIILATIWISTSEFVRNTFLLHNFWTEHYKNLGLVFPEQPINGAVWGIWSLCFAIAIFIFYKKYTLLQTTFLSWFVGFVFMWLVIGNLGVLPLGILVYAIPLSLFEAFIASYIYYKLSDLKK